MAPSGGSAGAGPAIRALDPGAAAVLLPLHAALHGLHAGRRPDVFHEAGGPEARAAHLAGLLARPGWFALLAEDAAGPAAYLLGETQRIAADPLQCARIRGFVHQIATRQDARRRGIASALLAAAKARFLAEGATVWATSYWTWNAASAGLMAKAGLAPAIVLADAPLG